MLVLVNISFCFGFTVVDLLVNRIFRCEVFCRGDRAVIIASDWEILGRKRALSGKYFSFYGYFSWGFSFSRQSSALQ